MPVFGVLLTKTLQIVVSKIWIMPHFAREISVDIESVKGIYNVTIGYWSGFQIAAKYVLWAWSLLLTANNFLQYFNKNFIFLIKVK